jgi:hypothetical protein
MLKEAGIGKVHKRQFNLLAGVLNFIANISQQNIVQLSNHHLQPWEAVLIKTT